MAAQEQAIRTRSIRHCIYKENISPLCRLCGERDETVAHLVSECKTLCQTQYKKWRHDTIAQVIHWQLCKAPVAPPGYLIGGAKRKGVWGGAPENFSWTTPSTLAINVTNAPFID